MLDVEMPGVDVEMPGVDVEMPGVDVEMPGVDVEMPLGSVFCQITKYLKLFNLASGHHPQIAKYRFLWQDHKPLEATPAKMTAEEAAAASAAGMQIYAGKTDGEQDILQAGICHPKESM